MTEPLAPPASPAPALQHEPNAAAPALTPAGQSQPADGADDSSFAPRVPQPNEYQLPSWQAQQNGLPVDFVAEQELRAAFHAAGVDNNLAVSLYAQAMHSARQELTPISVAGEYIAAERSLRQEWGAAFDANLKAANEAGRELFNALPKSIRGDMSYREFALVAGFANSAPIAKMLLARSRTRGGSSKTGG